MPGLSLAHDAIGMPHSIPALGLSWVQGAVPGWGTRGCVSTATLWLYKTRFCICLELR